MMIHFRRNALRVTVAALLSSAFGAQAADIPQVKVTVNDKQCEPMQVTVNAGKTQFIIQNHSQKALEWEILKGVMVVEERENIAPGFTQKLTANLQPGEYDMTCGLLTQPERQTDRHRRRHQRRGESGCGAEPRRRDHRL